MWVEAGWPDVLAEVAIHTTTVALPGHVGSRLAPEASAFEIEADISNADPAADTLIAFSAGAGLALRVAVAHPARFRSIVLLGIGDRMWTTPNDRMSFAERLREGRHADTRVLRSHAVAAGNDIEHVARFIAANPGPPPLHTLSRLSGSALIVLGAQDSVGPADSIAASLPNSGLVSIPRVDHYRTPTSPSVMRAALKFLGTAD